MPKQRYERPAQGDFPRTLTELDQWFLDQGVVLMIQQFETDSVDLPGGPHVVVDVKATALSVLGE